MITIKIVFVLVAATFIAPSSAGAWGGMGLNAMGGDMKGTLMGNMLGMGGEDPNTETQNAASLHSLMGGKDPNTETQNAAALHGLDPDDMINDYLAKQRLLGKRKLTVSVEYMQPIPKEPATNGTDGVTPDPFQQERNGHFGAPSDAMFVYGPLGMHPQGAPQGSYARPAYNPYPPGHPQNSLQDLYSGQHGQGGPSQGPQQGQGSPPEGAPPTPKNSPPPHGSYDPGQPTYHQDSSHSQGSPLPVSAGGPYLAANVNYGAPPHQQHGGFNPQGGFGQPSPPGGF